MKFNNVDFGRTVPFALIAEDVTDVVPRLVTVPLITCVCVVLPTLDVVVPMLEECVWVLLGIVAVVAPPEYESVNVALGPPDVTAAGSTVCVCVEWFGIEKVSA
jgi:hypothetical protein